MNLVSVITKLSINLGNVIPKLGVNLGICL